MNEEPEFSSPMPPRQNYAFLLSYDGRPYQGFQPQASLPTVCGVVDGALRQMGIGAQAFGASRTDARVQAIGQACSFQTRANLDVEELERGLNRALPSTIRIRGLANVPLSFHAHWSAIGKTYRYRISRFVLLGGKDEGKRPLPPLNPDRLAEAFRILALQPDLSAFSASNERDGGKARRIRPPRLLESTEEAGTLVEISGQGFGRYQIRNLMAAAIAFGAGEVDEENLMAMVRRETPPPFRAPAEGLCLFQVHYPPGATPFRHPFRLGDVLKSIPFMENYLTAGELEEGIVQEGAFHPWVEG